jgi:hypothetical protein
MVARRANVAGTDEPGDGPIATRAEPRVRGDWAVRIDADDGTHSEHSASYLSGGGAFVTELVAVTPDTPVRMTLTLGQETLTVDAVVRWVRATRVSAALPAGAGVAFRALTDRERERLRDVLSMGGSADPDEER